MKNVLITGGSRGIGRACVEKFAREGYAVSFIYNNSTEKADEVVANGKIVELLKTLENPPLYVKVKKKISIYLMPSLLKN